MGFFGPPNVEKLKETRNVKKLIKLLDYDKDKKIRRKAFQALGEIDVSEALDALKVRLSYEWDIEGQNYARKALQSDSARKALRSTYNPDAKKALKDDLKAQLKERANDSQQAKTQGTEQAIEWWKITGRSNANCNWCNKEIKRKEGYIVESRELTAASKVVSAVASVRPPDLICEKCFQKKLQVKPYPAVNFRQYLEFLK